MKTTKPLMIRVRSKTDVEVGDGIGMMPINLLVQKCFDHVKNLLTLFNIF